MLQESTWHQLTHSLCPPQLSSRSFTTFLVISPHSWTVSEPVSQSFSHLYPSWPMLNKFHVSVEDAPRNAVLGPLPPWSLPASTSVMHPLCHSLSPLIPSIALKSQIHLAPILVTASSLLSFYPCSPLVHPHITFKMIPIKVADHVTYGLKTLQWLATLEGILGKLWRPTTPNLIGPLATYPFLKQKKHLFIISKGLGTLSFYLIQRRVKVENNRKWNRF